MSRLLSRSHTFAIIVILDLKIHQSMWIHWPFVSKNLNQRSLTPRWPLTPCLLRLHVWLYPRIIVSKSHDNTSLYVDTVINFAKYHIHTHTTYILHTYIHTYIHTHTTYRMSDHIQLHIVSYWTQFRRDKKKYFVYMIFFVFVLFLFCFCFCFVFVFVLFLTIVFKCLFRCLTSV